MSSLTHSFLRHWFTPHHSNNQRARLLHPSAISIIIGLFTLGQVVLHVVIAQFPQVLGYAAAKISSDEIIRLTNLERQTLGISPIKLNDQLSKAAAQKAADMFARDYWAHVSPIGTQPWYFITQNNYAYRYAGENLARDFSDPQAVVKAWLASPSHRENLLNDKYQDIGVAVVDGKLAGRETTLVVQMFGTRLAGIPSISTTNIKAASTQPQTSLANTISTITVSAPAFSVTKYLSILLLGIFVAVLVIDLITVYRRQIARWTSNSFAHLVFMVTLLLAVTLLSVGQII